MCANKIASEYLTVDIAREVLYVDGVINLNVLLRDPLREIQGQKFPWHCLGTAGVFPKRMRLNVIITDVTCTLEVDEN